MRSHASPKDTSHVDVATTEIGRPQGAFAQARVCGFALDLNEGGPDGEDDASGHSA